MTIGDIKDSKAALEFQEFDYTDAAKQPFMGGPDPSGFGLGAKPGWANLNFYTKYFNVTTAEVHERLRSAATADAAFLEKLNGRLDFYGPLWISVSVAVVLFVSSSFTKRAWAHPGETLDFHLLTMGIIEMVLYTAFQSAMSWGFFRWRSVDGVKAGEMVALSGYSLALLLPALVVSMVPLSLAQWAAFTAAAAASSLFIYRNLWPILQTSPSIRHEQAALFTTCTLAIHVLFFLTLRVTFFKHVHAPIVSKP